MDNKNLKYNMEKFLAKNYYVVYIGPIIINECASL